MGRALDAELATPAPAGATHQVYVVEAIGDDGATDLYVGQTSGAVEERIEVHRDGGVGAARIFRKAATVGDPRPDLLGHDDATEGPLPDLLEQFVVADDRSRRLDTRLVQRGGQISRRRFQEAA